MTLAKPRSMRDSGLESGWLAEMAGKYGPPKIPTPLRHKATRTFEWRWPHVASVRLRVLDPSRGGAESSVLAVTAVIPGVDVQVRCATGLPTEAQIRAALVAAGLLDTADTPRCAEVDGIEVPS